MKKNILICSNNLCIGGIEKSLISLLKQIDYNKYNVDLLLESNEGELIKEVPKNVKIIEYKVYNLKNKLLQKTKNYLNQIIYTLKNKNKYDTSICFATYSYPANKISRISSKNSIIYVHSDYTKLYNENEFKEFINTRNFDKFKKIIFVSNESKNNFLKFYPNYINKSIVINNIVDTNLIKKQSKENIDIEFNKNNINLLFVGRLEETSKNITTQLKLINDLKEKILNIKLYIIGDGPNKEDYVNYIKENKLEKYITLLGQKLNPYPYIKKCDYLLLTSNYEGYPVIFNEANILEKDIISTIKISDEYTSIGDNFGYLISNNYKETLKVLEDILINKKHKQTKINIEDINNKRIKKLEEIFNEE